MTLIDAHVYGLSDEHVVDWRQWQVHANIVADLESFLADAAREGFELGIASAFRSFEQQRTIWNEKARGTRPILDDQECTVSLDGLSPLQRVEKIMRWSALPGASRHHWGTDFDIYDAAVVEHSDYQLQLTQTEAQPGGAFEQMHKWLTAYLERDHCAFYRPYMIDRGGIACEPWHLSHKVHSRPMQKMLSVTALREVLSETELELAGTVMDKLETLFDRFIRS